MKTARKADKPPVRDSTVLRLTIGPLRYEFRAYDAWAQRTLGRLRRHIRCVAFAGRPHRVLHLVKSRLSLGDRPLEAAEGLPPGLAALLKQSIPPKGWEGRSDHTGRVLWLHPRSVHAIWTFGLETPHQQTIYQLPWHRLLEDIVRRGGGVVHAGLAFIESRGYLFTAPPGGGKTTALSRIPAPWRVFSDDTSLIWAEGRGDFRASALPTWSVLTGAHKALPSIAKWEVQRSFPVAGLVLLKKSERLRLTLLPPVQAAPHLYRALCEYPAVLLSRESFKKELFHTACAVARALPLWEMGTTRRGSFWRLLNDSINSEKDK